MVSQMQPRLTTQLLSFQKKTVSENIVQVINIIDSRAFYWTGTIGTNDYASSDFTFSDSEASVDDANAHVYGFGVRCIKD